MKKQIKYILVASFIAFLSSFGTAFYLNNKLEHKKIEKVDMVETMNIVYDELQLTKNQVQKFNSSTGQFHRKNKQLSNKIKQNLLDYYTELSSYSPDSFKLESMANINGKLNIQLMQNSSQYFQQTSSFLKPEQRVKLKSIYHSAYKNEQANGK